uniref:Elongation of very long chain fatty acids protein n=1 Tax=Blattella germanica TaxID=6973 RepID=A0A8A5N3I7_BLAGE|nr:fatty acid elongase 1 [Blattella germanica]
MTAVIRACFKGYRHLFHELSDPRSNDMFLMQSVWQPVTVVSLYLYFSLSLGPRLMKNRPPLNIESIMKIYNLLQIPLNIYVIERALTLGWATRYRWICEPVDYSESPYQRQVIYAVWSYMMLKFLDLADTVFFVLRKKATHVSFLHVYHHAGVFFGAWVLAKFLPGGHGTFLGAINCFIHIIMYSYYFVTMQWSEYKEKIWWKKYITQLQMVQFFLVTIHSLIAIFTKDCGYPKFICGLMVFQYTFMFFLFLDFYMKAYGKKSV